MPTFRQLKPDQRFKLKKMAIELMDLNNKAIEICEKMKVPYLSQNNFILAFLKNERTIEQLETMIESSRARQLLRSGL